MRSTVLVLLAALATAANAAPTLSFEPANPTPADTIVLTIRDSAPTCPFFVVASTRFAPPNEIRLVVSHIGDCGFAPFSEAKATLGQLPAGTYTVFVTDNAPDITPPPGYTQQLTVSFPAGAGGPTAAAPLENYAGHYLTGHAGEGVFIEQFGEKSFLALATYDAEGRPEWLVMPDGRWRYNAFRTRFEFSGSMYRTRRGQESPPAIHATPLGAGVWYPAGFETAMFEATIDGRIVTRTLSRFRF